MGSKDKSLSEIAAEQGIVKTSLEVKIPEHVSAGQTGTAGFGFALADVRKDESLKVKDILAKIAADKQLEFTCIRAADEIEQRRDDEIKRLTSEFQGSDTKKLDKDQAAALSKAVSNVRNWAARMSLLIWAIRRGHYEGIKKFSLEGMITSARQLRMAETTGSSKRDKGLNPTTDSQAERAEAYVDGMNVVQMKRLMDKLAAEGAKQTGDPQFADECSKYLEATKARKPRIELKNTPAVEEPVKMAA